MLSLIVRDGLNAKDSLELVNTQVQEASEQGGFNRLHIFDIFNQGPVGNIPVVDSRKSINLCKIPDLVKKCINLSEEDWNSSDMSWDFSEPDILLSNGRTISEKYKSLKGKWVWRIDEIRNAEEEINRIFIEAYGLIG